MKIKSLTKSLRVTFAAAIFLGVGVLAQSACEVCSDAVKCGGGHTPVSAPGMGNIIECDGEAEDSQCVSCDGINTIRYCIGSGQPNNRHCVKKDVACGKKRNGTCQTVTIGIPPFFSGDVTYCKQSGTAGADCDVAAACSGTAAD